MTTTSWKKEIIVNFILAGLTILILCLLYHGIDLERPIIYSEDGVSAAYLVKTIDDTGWFLENPWVGGANGANWGDYTMCDNLSFFIVKLISLFSDNCYLIFNLFYFSTYVLVSLSAYMVMRHFRIKTFVAMTGALLYSFLAYHQLRIPHVWLTPYFMVPFGLMVGIWIATDQCRVDEKKWSRLFRSKKMIATTVILFFSAYTGFYYAFFTYVVLCIAGVVLLLKKVSWKRIGFLLYSFFVVFLGILSNVYPSILYWMKHGMNQDSELLLRGAESSEVYAFKMTQLLMPRLEHRLSLLARIAKSYYEQFPLNNENHSATLGIVAGIGFILLLIVLFRKKSDLLFITEIAQLNLGIFLVAIIGGIGGIFGICFSTPMRCYNRLSIYIAFLALLYLGLIATKYIESVKQSKGKRLVCMIVCFAVLCGGLWDQTVNFGASDQKKEAVSFDSDRNFVRAIEKEVPECTMVFQLPIIRFPSGVSYEHFKGYIHSTKIIWSYGGMQGREEDDWENGLKADSTEEFLDDIYEAGYRGLYVDRVLYEQEGNDFERLQKELLESMESHPIVSEDGRLFFYDLRERK